MHEQPRREVVAAALAAIDERTETELDVAMAALVRAAWPGGVGDRVEPGAREWVRRWGPNPLTPAYLDDCSCAGGRCGVCN